MEYRSLRARNHPSYVIPDSDEDEKKMKKMKRKNDSNNNNNNNSNNNNKLRYKEELPRDEQDNNSYSLRNHRSTRNSHRDSLSNVVQRPSEKVGSRRHHSTGGSDIDDYNQSKRKNKSHSTSLIEKGDAVKGYKFRDRDRHQRTQLNVSHLGGKGKGKSYETHETDNLSESENDNNNDDENGNENEILGEDENEQTDENEDNDKKKKTKKNEKGDNEEDENEEDDDNDNDEDDEDEDEESPIKKYSFRDRTMHRRETLNVTHLGGDGQSYLKKTKSHSNSNAQSTYTTPRLYLGGKIPVHDRNDRRPHPSYKRSRHYASRNHFDSSSESSSDSSRGREKKRYRGYSERNPHDEERHFHEHEQERLRAELSSIVPLSSGKSGTNALNGTGGSVKDKVSKRDISRADVNPIAVDSSIGFASVGGLDSHVRALKEMVVLPLLYPDVFHRFDTQPPRGVLFVGPPGTGKTLTARALANSLSTAGGPTTGSIGGKKVSFFMRKGADCLSKWVGEGERQLRLLFEQAKRYEPSIIFFDEIDGLAPVRSIKQDQIHASIVSTLLALMDGLDSRGQVVVIGATNRPDAIDPALRRPGRFDRELLFPLPDADARRAILQIHTVNWQPPLPSHLMDWIVDSSSGYCGADIKALCSEAAIISLRRAYPQVYLSNLRLEIDPSSINITRGDFAAALSRVIPASRRAASTAPSRSIDAIAKPLLTRHIDATLVKIKQVFALADISIVSQNSNDITAAATATATTNPTSTTTVGGASPFDFGKGFEEEWIASLTDVQDLWNSDQKINTSVIWDSNAMSSRSRVLISGRRGMSHTDIAGVVLQRLESFQVFNLDINAIISDSAYFSPEQALISRIFEARKAAPCVIYFPDIVGWCKVANDSLKTILLSLLDSFPVTIPILWVSTFIWDDIDQTTDDSTEINEIDGKIIHLVSWLSGGSFLQGVSKTLSELGSQVSSHPNVVTLATPTKEERYLFFNQFFTSLATLPQAFYEARKTFFKARNQKLAYSTTPAPLPSSQSNINETSASNTLASTTPHTTTITTSTSTASDNERDENYIREQRLFFWTALSELKRDKKFFSLIRSVDPEQVPDYYDVVTAPMDLETMRSKVDADLYPTFKSFIYDFEQIIFNAKEYNPLNSRDTRGRSIVSAAHHMLDVVKTHAFAFKERLGYDVFKRCEDLYFRKHGNFPFLNVENRSIMPEENKIYYREILNYHLQLKKEFEEEERNKIPKEEPQVLEIESQAQPQSQSQAQSPPRNLRKHDLDVSSSSNNNGGNEGIMISCDERALRKRARAAKVHKVVESVNGSVDRNVGDDTTTTGACDHSETSPHTTTEIAPPPQSSSEVTMESITVTDPPPMFQSPIEYDICKCPLAAAYESSIALSNEMREQGFFQQLLEKVLNLTNGWCISELITLYANFKRCTREFQLQGDWTKLIQELEKTVTPSSSSSLA